VLKLDPDLLNDLLDCEFYEVT